MARSTSRQSDQDEFLAALDPLQDGGDHGIAAQLRFLLPSSAVFRRWSDSIWLSAFLSGRMTERLALVKPTMRNSPTGRIQGFLEAALGQGSFFSAEALIHHLPAAIRCTCCVMIDGQVRGSGFLIGPDRVLTNWHVVRDALTAPDRIAVVFDHFRAVVATGSPPSAYGCKEILGWSPASRQVAPGSPHSDRPLDYALLRLLEEPAGAREHFDLSQAPASLPTGTRVIVIGHPNRQPLAVSFSRQVGLHDVDPPRAFYDADTLHGSSGSIVLVDDAGRLRPALLHQGGESPTRNFGVFLSHIAEDIEDVKDAVPTSCRPIDSADARRRDLEAWLGDPELRNGRVAALVAARPPDAPPLDLSADPSDLVHQVLRQAGPDELRALEIAQLAEPANQPVPWRLITALALVGGVGLGVLAYVPPPTPAVELDDSLRQSLDVVNACMGSTESVEFTVYDVCEAAPVEDATVAIVDKVRATLGGAPALWSPFDTTSLDPVDRASLKVATNDRGIARLSCPLPCFFKAPRFDVRVEKNGTGMTFYRLRSDEEPLVFQSPTRLTITIMVAPGLPVGGAEVRLLGVESGPGVARDEGCTAQARQRTEADGRATFVLDDRCYTNGKQPACNATFRVDVTGPTIHGGSHLATNGATVDVRPRQVHCCAAGWREAAESVARSLSARHSTCSCGGAGGNVICMYDTLQGTAPRSLNVPCSCAGGCR